MSNFLEARFPAFAAAVGEYRLLGEYKAKCRCPNNIRHRAGDQHFSLLAKLGETNSLVAKCMAGCPLSEVLHAAGLKYRDICANAPKKGHVVSQIVKKYVYNDPDGSFAYEVAKYHPKAFKPRRRHPACGEHWVYNINGGIVKSVHDHSEATGRKWIDSGKPLNAQADRGEVALAPCVMWPYNADLIASTDRIILWHEGEGCADITSEMGFISTTTQGGSSGTIFRKEWVKLFRDRHIVFLPDNDEAGSKYMRYYLGCLLEAKAASVTPLRLPKLPEKGDVKEWAFANRKGPEDVGPNSTPAKLLKSLIAKATGYGRNELKKIIHGT